MVRFGLPFLSGKHEPDYEILLNKLQTEIQDKQARIDSIQKQYSRVNRAFYIYGIGFWVLYVAIVWLGLVKKGPLAWVSVLLLLVFFAALRNMYQWWLKRRLTKEKASLENLLKQRKAKVEELKQKTGYYTTQGLLEKYDTSSAGISRDTLKAKPTGNDKEKKASMKKKQSFDSKMDYAKPPVAANVLMTPRDRKSGRVLSQLDSPTFHSRSVSAAPHVFSAPSPYNYNDHPPEQQQPPSQFPASGVQDPYYGQAPLQQQQQQQNQQLEQPLLPTNQRPSIFDRVVDRLLGISDQDVNASQQYALICKNCFAHNGLATKDEFPHIRYVCPVCGYFNGPNEPVPDAAADTQYQIDSQPNYDHQPMAYTDPGLYEPHGQQQQQHQHQHQQQPIAASEQDQAFEPNQGQQQDHELGTDTGSSLQDESPSSRHAKRAVSGDN